MRRARLVGLALALASPLGCGGQPSQVDLTLAVDPALTDQMVQSLVQLDVDVSGAESAHASYPLAHPFASAREERVVYHPLAASGTIEIRAIARDLTGVGVVAGETSVALRPSGAMTAKVILTTDGPGLDGGVDLGALDLAAPDLELTDLAGPCAGLDAGALCGTGDACHDAPTCESGVCTPHPKTDGTVCAATTNKCKSSGTCQAGVCGAITNKAAGTVCSPRTNACRTDGVCDGKGTCGAQTVRADGYNYDTTNALARCCGGSPVSVDTATNCGACGINCNGGACTSRAGYLYCTCTSNAQCWSGCCSIAYGSPYICSAGNCSTGNAIACPGNATNTNPASGPFVCHYPGAP